MPRTRLPWILSFVLSVWGLATNAAVAADVVVPGYELLSRQAPRPAAARLGHLLIAELNCKSCHQSISSSDYRPRVAPVLTNVSRRVSRDYIRRFLADPQAVKPGTAMPRIVALAGEANTDKIDALAAFLTHGSMWKPTGINAAGIERGEELFHTIGCATCHGDQRVAPEKRPVAAMPLGPLHLKYTVTSLTQFLSDPHAVRPSGRMPSLNLTPAESRDVASYLMRDLDPETVVASMKYALYHGSFQSLPDFTQLTPTATGTANEFDLALSDRKEEFALKFEGYLQLPAAGEYEFWLKSDDGSRLRIDGETVIDYDGVHPAGERSAKVQLAEGPHEVVVEYFEYHGDEFLSVEMAGPELARQSAAQVMTPEKTPRHARDASPVDSPERIAFGRRLFVELGCANCHQHGTGEDRIAAAQLSTAARPSRLDDGCLSQSPQSSVPDYALSEQQRTDIRAALSGPADFQVAGEEHVQQTMAAFNCFACHVRDGLGGVTTATRPLFNGTIPEMGDEGSLPPALDGAGDKLTSAWLTHLLNNGSKDRPYMLTRMPRFSSDNMGSLVKSLAELDHGEAVPSVAFADPEHRVKAAARRMIGDQALSCIKCHSFAQYKATGIQAISLTTMTQRLRRDWFHRYLLNPQEYRPGTRMPAAWPNGRSVVPQILSPSPSDQIEAIWQYLGDGSNARLPTGLVTEAIELVPDNRPIIYRNFIEGLSPRGIAVGMPEKAHYAWDADQLTLRLIWHNAFIDASKHWVGRGPGRQTPLGDHIMTLPPGPPLAQLPDVTASWPAIDAVRKEFDFLGYRLDSDGRPHFRYRWNESTITDSIIPVPGEAEASLQRELSMSDMTADRPAYFRVASGEIAATKDGWLVNQSVRLSNFTIKPQIRLVDGGSELLVPITTDASGRGSVRYLIEW